MNISFVPSYVLESLKQINREVGGVLQQMHGQKDRQRHCVQGKQILKTDLSMQRFLQKGTQLNGRTNKLQTVLLVYVRTTLGRRNENHLSLVIVVLTPLHITAIILEKVELD